jgi:hypothetical protein
VISQQRIFRTWLPLAASWALMTVEYPIIQAAIARLPEVETMLAATGLVIGLEITIEAPVIMLLATSTALARSPQAYRVLRAFTIHLNVVLTIVAAAVAFVDPIYEALVPGLLGIPGPIAEAAQPAMMIMTPWTAAIGWRRFYQGILIRFGRARVVGIGTGVRLVFAAGTAIGLAATGSVPGVIVGACAWMAGVTTEMLYIHIAAASTVREHLSGDGDGVEDPLTYRGALRFHSPLAATSVLALLVMPLVQAGLSRMPDPVENLAAWPVAFAILLLFRSPGFALPEAVIALLASRRELSPLRRFSLWVASGSSVALMVFIATPLLHGYLVVLEVPERLVGYALPGLVVGLLIPALQTAQSWYRGVLMTGGATGHVYWGMGVSLVVTTLVILGAVLAQWPGVSSAMFGIACGMGAESAYLAWTSAGVAKRLPEAVSPSRSRAGSGATGSA